MHEFALADAVVRTVIQTADAEGLTRVTAVRIRVGELQQIKPEILAFALQELHPDDPRLVGADMRVDVVPARFRCRACEHEFTMSETEERSDDASEAIHFVPELAHAYMHCPSCQSPDFEIVAGRGVDIAAIEGECPDD